MPNIASQVAIVTGGSGGIGRAVATRFGADGMDVVVHYSGNVARAEEVAAGIRDAGGRAITAQADVADENDVARIFQAATDEFGGVDIVVNTAGIMPLAPIAEMSLSDFDRVIRTNLRGTFVVDQAAARSVRSGGSIVNFSTSVTRLQQPTYGAYAATKAGTEALALILARELRGRDVTVNTVAPGPTGTDLFFDGKSQEVIDRLAGLSPLERLGTPDDIATSVVNLIRSRWINGQTIYVNGGIA